MAGFRVHVGTYENTTGINRTQSVTGVGFAGTFLMTLSASMDTAGLDTLALMQAHSVGFARSNDVDGSGQVVHGLSALWNALVGRTQGAADADTSKVVHETFNAANGSQGSSIDDALVSFDADGFTLHGTCFSAYRHHYLMLGGDDVVAEPFQHVASPAMAGAQPITGASQTPTLAIFAVTTFSAPGGITWTLGWYDGTRQGTSALQEKMYATVGVDQHYQSAAHCVAILDPATGAVTGRAACTGFTDDGLSLTWDVVPASPVTVTVILLSGITAECGAFLQPAAIGAHIVSVPTVDPRAVVLLSSGRPVSATVGDDVRIAMGISNGADAQLGTWHGDNTGTTSAANETNLRWMSQTTALTLAHPTAPGAGVVDAHATLTDFDPQGAFTVDWSLVDGASNEVLYLALGPAASTPPIFVAPATQTRTIRRMRQAPHIWDGTSAHRISYPGFQLLFEAGVPLPAAVPPAVRQLATDADYFTRAAAFLVPSEDWTRGFWTRVGPVTQDLWLLQSDGVFTPPYVTIGWTAGGDGWTLIADAGAGAVTTTVEPVTLNAWSYLTLKYRAADTALDLYVNARLADTITIDLVDMPPQTAEFLGSDLATTPADANLAALAYDGLWQAALTGAEIRTQMYQRAPVRTTDLLAFVPLLATVGGLQDVSGHGRPWTQEGAWTAVDGPLAGPTPELVFFLQWSDDGGHTWSNLHPIAAGAVGQYQHRAIWRRLGQSRFRVFRVIESNRAKIVLLDALLDPDPLPGTS